MTWIYDNVADKVTQYYEEIKNEVCNIEKATLPEGGLNPHLCIKEGETREVYVIINFKAIETLCELLANSCDRNVDKIIDFLVKTGFFKIQKMKIKRYNKLDESEYKGKYPFLLINNVGYTVVEANISYDKLMAFSDLMLYYGEINDAKMQYITSSMYKHQKELLMALDYYLSNG